MTVVQLHGKSAGRGSGSDRRSIVAGRAFGRSAGEPGRDALLRVCTDQDWWLGLRRGAEDVAGPFTWEQCAVDTLAVYDRVLYGRVSVPAKAA